MGQSSKLIQRERGKQKQKDISGNKNAKITKKKQKNAKEEIFHEKITKL